MSERDAQQNQAEIAIALRRRQVATLLLQRKRQTEIADALGVSKATICGDVKAIRQEWREEDASDISDLVAQELQVLDVDEARLRKLRDDPETVKSLRAFCLIQHEIHLIQQTRGKWLKFEDRRPPVAASELDAVLASLGLGK